MLEQYASGTKKQRTVTMETKHSVPKKHSQLEPSRPRNRFATLLQWRNQSEEGDGELEGTRSRYATPGVPQSDDEDGDDDDVVLEEMWY